MKTEKPFKLVLSCSKLPTFNGRINIIGEKKIPFLKSKELKKLLSGEPLIIKRIKL